MSRLVSDESEQRSGHFLTAVSMPEADFLIVDGVGLSDEMRSMRRPEIDFR